MENELVKLLTNLGAFGGALAVVGGAAWAVWKKVVEPQNKQYIDTLKAINEKNDEFSEKHLKSEEEHLEAVRELNADMRSHNEKAGIHDERMGREHERISGEIKEK